MNPRICLARIQPSTRPASSCAPIFLFPNLLRESYPLALFFLLLNLPLPRPFCMVHSVSDVSHQCADTLWDERLQWGFCAVAELATIVVTASARLKDLASLCIPRPCACSRGVSGFFSPKPAFLSKNRVFGQAGKFRTCCRGQLWPCERLRAYMQEVSEFRTCCRL